MSHARNGRHATLTRPYFHDYTARVSAAEIVASRARKLSWPRSVAIIQLQFLPRTISHPAAEAHR